MLHRSTPAIRLGNHALSIIQNKFTTTEYRMAANWVFVIERGRLVTCYQTSTNDFVRANHEEGQ